MDNRPNYVNAGVAIYFRKCQLSLNGTTCTRSYIATSSSGTSEDYDVKDIESSWSGLAYIKSDGLFDIGEKKNLYTEEYADSNMLRYYQKDGAAMKNTTVDIELIFTGSDRKLRLSSFMRYILKNSITYSGTTYSNLVNEFWDSKREMHAFLIYKDSVESEEVFTGGEPYIKLTLKFTNVFGRCFMASEISNNTFTIQ